MHYARSGAILGDTILFNEGKYVAFACAIEDTEILAIDKKSFEGLIYTYPVIGIRMLSDFGNRIRSLKHFAAEIALNDIKKRTVRMILEILRERGVDAKNSVVISNIPTQDEMAYRVGTVREVLCKCLHKLEKEKLIKVKRGAVVINNIDKLKEMVYFEDDESLFPITLPMKEINTPNDRLVHHR